MSIDRIRYFAAVVETRNLRKAAEMVGISAPSMSKAISVLEDELGQKLIHPEGRGIGITPKGLQIYKQAIALLEEHKKFYQNIQNETESTQFRMATFEVFSSHFISSFIASEKKDEFLVLEKSPGEIEEAILEGIVDFGITYIPSPHPNLEYAEIGSFEMELYGTKKWEKKEFSELPFAIPVTELKIHSSEFDSLDMYPADAPKRNVKFRFELLETALQTSSLGESVIYCPDFIVKLYNDHAKQSFQLQKLDKPSGFKKQKPKKIYLVAKKGNVSVELERKFAKFIRSLK